MPPEQARGEELDERGDLYSLGATLYELLTNRPPFEGSESDVVQQHLSAVPKPPTRLRPELPDTLDNLTLRLLQKNHLERPTDAGTVLESLRAVQEQLEDVTVDLASLIAAGENHRLEFKSTLRFDLETRTKNSALEGAVAKAVAGLLNAEGGTLLIGVNDQGEIVGIEMDFQTLHKRPNLDGWQLALSEALIKHLGHDAAGCVGVSLAEEEGKLVAVLRCPARTSPTWFNSGSKSQLYTRISNSTRPLPAAAEDAFIRKHWPKA
jgi:hypothetical protein